MKLQSQAVIRSKARCHLGERERERERHREAETEHNVDYLHVLHDRSMYFMILEKYVYIPQQFR